MLGCDSLEEHIPRLRRYALALTGDRQRADDLVQDTLERALRKLALWRRGSDLRAWLFTLMHNVFANQRRDAREHLFAALDADVPEPAARSRADEGLALRDLTTALAQLPVEFREAVLLVGLEELSYEETARVLRVPVGTVMSRLARGRERLRLLMAGEPTAPVLRRVK